MTKTYWTSAMAGLLGATVLTPAAFAQSAGDLAEQGQSCQALQTLYTEESDRLREEWIEQTRSAVDQADQAQCQVYYEQAVTELAQLGGAEPQAGQQTADLAQDQGCEALQALTAAEADRLRDEWETQARSVVQAGDAAQCQTLYQQAQAELQQPVAGGADPAAQAEIVVTQPEPEISVAAPPPEVTVTQGQPQVEVNQGTPEILVRQAPPVVRVEVAPPVVTIEQPPPEIIITFPDPQVAVTNPEPQVEVRQPPPTVRVEQAEPQVQVQQSENGGAAQVQGQPQAAQVTVQQTEGQPEVQVTREEPRVTFEAAEPQVEVTQTGEPQVQFSQTGEPSITVQQAGEEGQQAAGAQAQPPVAEGGLDVENPELTAGEQEAAEGLEGEAAPESP